MNAEAAAIVAQLQLIPLPHEGGFFRQTWRCTVASDGGRPRGTAIYFLLTPEDFSALHRLETDELWHFHAGDPVEHLQLLPRDRSAQLTLLGADVLGGCTPQLAVPGGTWQGARSASGARGWSLLSCTMAPGWDEREFTLANRAELQGEFPAHAALIAALTRAEP